jgi:diguanylate cyclase (GGDEF)-like protein/PAS domain S-box-containing protein
VLPVQKTAAPPAALAPAGVPAPRLAEALNDSATLEAGVVLSSVVALDLTEALDTLGVGWCLHGPDGDLWRANRFGRDLLAAGPDPMVDLSGTPLLPQDHPVAVTLRTGRAVRSVVLGVRSGTTQLRWVRVDTAVVERGTGHGDRCVVTLLVDVTAETERSRESAPAERATRLMTPVADVRIAGDQELAAAEESFRLAFDSASCAMARLTSDGRLQRVNDVLCAMVGRSRTELEGRPLRLLTHPDDPDPVAELADRLATGDTELRRDQRLLRRDGSTAWVDLTLTAVRALGDRALGDQALGDQALGDQVRHLVAQLVDTTAERVLAEQLRGPDLHDPLTTAATAELLRERLDAALEDPRRPAVALMRVDLDRFRQLNDVRGQVAADRVLVVTVQRLRTAARETDLVARLGGDDFAVLCVGVDHAHVERFAQKVSRSLSGSIGGIGPVTASIGVATARPGDGSDDVLNRAAAALSVVKRSGGSGWAVD